MLLTIDAQMYNAENVVLSYYYTSADMLGSKLVSVNRQQMA